MRLLSLDICETLDAETPSARASFAPFPWAARMYSSNVIGPEIKRILKEAQAFPKDHLLYSAKPS